MKLLWLCNVAPSVVQNNMTGKTEGGGLWMDHVLSDLRKENLTVHILCLFRERKAGRIDEGCSYATFTEGAPHDYLPQLEEQFRQEVMAFEPDVIHIWGTEYGHTLAMVNACEKAGMLDRVVVNIQGLCSVIARHYAEGVPAHVQNSYTFRDFVRQDNIRQQKKKFVRRGELEIQALRKVRHVIGRTDMDRAWSTQINPEVMYHFCNETLREGFYQGRWQYKNCRKHSIFASSCAYPVKGFHYLLEAFVQVLKKYPDATLTVTGNSFVHAQGLKNKLRQNSYHQYLAKMIFRYGLEHKVKFLGGLSEEQMKQAYLDANVFVLPSTIENSPNSLGEAMLLGVPCVASNVGGVYNLLRHSTEGYVYPSAAPYMLAYYVSQVFEQGACEEITEAARQHAMQTHHSIANHKRLLEIYSTVISGIVSR